MAFSIVLAGKGFAADGADEGAFVGVGAEVGSEVVGSCESLCAEVAVEVCGVFLDFYAWGPGGGGCAVGVGEV